MRGKKIDPEIKKRIIKLRQEGLLRDVIRERLGVNDFIITKALQEYRKSRTPVAPVKQSCARMKDESNEDL